MLWWICCHLKSSYQAELTCGCDMKIWKTEMGKKMSGKCLENFWGLAEDLEERGAACGAAPGPRLLTQWPAAWLQRGGWPEECGDSSVLVWLMTKLNLHGQLILAQRSACRWEALQQPRRDPSLGGLSRGQRAGCHGALGAGLSGWALMRFLRRDRTGRAPQLPAGSCGRPGLT